MSFVKMPQEDYIMMCNKLRAMLNKTDAYTSKDFIEKMDELILPNLDDMDFGSNGNLPEKGSSNPQYYEDIANAINEVKQADAIALEELDVTENKKYIAPQGVAYSVVNVDVENSGNLNYIETIEDLPITLVDGRIDEIVNGIDNHTLTAYIECSQGPRAYATHIDDRLVFSSMFLRDDGSLLEISGVNIQYSLSIKEESLSVYHNGYKWVNFPIDAMVTLTIIHHPILNSGT